MRDDNREFTEEEFNRIMDQIENSLIYTKFDSPDEIPDDVPPEAAERMDVMQ